MNSINAWQQLGRMGMLARTCAPLRDLENDIERMRRQNIVLEKTLKKAAGPQRIAALREQLMTGQAAVETGLKNVQRVLLVATEVAQRHKQLLMAWYANESIDWGKYGELYQSLMNQLRDALQIVMQGRTSQSNLVTIMAVGRFPMQLEIIWRAYKQLVKENRWYATDYVLKPFNRECSCPACWRNLQRLERAQASVVKPATRLRTEPGPDGDMQFVSDVYHYENDTQFLNELTQSLGFCYGDSWRGGRGVAGRMNLACFTL